MIDGVGAMSATKAAWSSLGADSLGASSAGTAAASASGSSGDFGSVLGQVVQKALGSIENGEAAAIQGVQGAMSPFKVVEAVMSAQRTLQTVISMRDKAVSAYQEITQMAI